MGETVTLMVNVLPETADQEFTATVRDPSVATVSGA